MRTFDRIAMYTCRGVLLLSLLVTAGCKRAEVTELVVGDAAPRADSLSTLTQLVRDDFVASGVRDLRLESWSTRHTEMVGSEIMAAETFVRTTGMVAVVGHTGSKNTLIAAPVYRDQNVPLIVPTATSRQLTRAGSHVFMLAPTDEAEGVFLANSAIDSLRATRIAILYVADAYGTGIVDGVTAGLAKRNSAFVGRAAIAGRECEPDSLAVRGIVRALIQRSKPDLVMLALAAKPTLCAIREIIAADSTVRILSADSFDPSSAESRQLTRRERAAVTCVAFWDPTRDSLARAFVERTRRVAGRDPEAGEALSYDGFMMVAAAVKEGHRSPQAVMRWLRDLGTPAHPPFQGVTGPIAFNQDRAAILRLRSLADPVGPP